MNVKYWMGWHSSHNMKNPEYITKWLAWVQKAEESGMKVIIFQVPEDKEAHYTTEIENLIQQQEK